MGGLFSSTSSTKSEESERLAEFRQQNVSRADNHETTVQNYPVISIRQMMRLSYSPPRRRIMERVNIIRNLPSIDSFELITIPRNSKIYQHIHAKFKKTAKSNMEVVSIKYINNPILKTLYELRKNELKVIYNVQPWQNIEAELFHGTLQQHFTSICKNNLDRRKCMKHKFGIGVSFSPISFYASHYCDKDKIMLLCKVIVIKSMVGDDNTKIPLYGFDHTTNEKGHVIVKYDDDTYYPEYVITFKIQEPPINYQSQPPIFIDNSLEQIIATYQRHNLF